MTLLTLCYKRGVDLISDALPFGRLLYGRPNAASNTIGYAKHYSWSRDVVIRVYDVSGNANETHEHAGDFNEWQSLFRLVPRNGWRDNSHRHAMASTAIEPGGKRVYRFYLPLITVFP